MQRNAAANHGSTERMKQRIKTSLAKAQAAANKAEEALAAAAQLAKGLRARAQEAKDRIKEARRAYRTLKKHFRQACRDKRSAKKQKIAAFKALRRIQKKLGETGSARAPRQAKE